MDHADKKTIVVAGASGLVGRALPAALGAKFNLIGMSRQPPSILQVSDSEHDYVWREADLFSRKQTLLATEGADLAIYLVHSMRPTAALTQGQMHDMDLLCADNFSRAAEYHGISKIICISSLNANDEVEKTLGSRGAKVCVLRASIILGPGGDRAEMLVRLVETLPMMLLPAWTRTRVRPIARNDIVEAIRWVLENDQAAACIWNVAGPDVTSFAELLEVTADIMGLKRKFWTIGIDAPRSSSLWISTFTGLPSGMIRTTIESLRDENLRDESELRALPGLPQTPLRESMQRTVDSRKDAHSLTKRVAKPTPPIVRSVQRLQLPPGRGAEWVSMLYTRWLSRVLWPFLHVEIKDEKFVHFKVRLLPWPVLILERDHHVSQPDRQLFWIRGGLLAGNQSQGRLEFREVLDKKYVLAAIHDFHPRLPWPTYLLTQARIHLLVMYAFARYLKRVCKSQRLPPDKTDQITGPDSKRKCP